MKDEEFHRALRPFPALQSVGQSDRPQPACQANPPCRLPRPSPSRTTHPHPRLFLLGNCVCARGAGNGRNGEGRRVVRGACLGRRQKNPMRLLIAKNRSKPVGSPPQLVKCTVKFHPNAPRHSIILRNRLFVSRFAPDPQNAVDSMADGELWSLMPERSAEDIHFAVFVYVGDAGAFGPKVSGNLLRRPVACGRRWGRR